MRVDWSSASSWETIIERLATTRNLYGSKRELDKEERRLIALLARELQYAEISPSRAAEMGGCSNQNIYQFFTGRHGITIIQLRKWVNLLGLDFYVSVTRRSN